MNDLLDIEQIDAVDMLARMVALSPAFQKEVEKFTEESADTRIHRVLLEHPEDHPRPFAVVSHGQLNSTRIAGGARNTYSYEAFVIWQLAGEMQVPDNLEASLSQFWAWAKRVFLEVHELGGYDCHLNITEATQEQDPVASHPLGGDVVPWCWCSWRVNYATF